MSIGHDSMSHRFVLWGLIHRRATGLNDVLHMAMDVRVAPVDGVISSGGSTGDVVGELELLQASRRMRGIH
jgi:hypothetical protein